MSKTCPGQKREFNEIIDNFIDILLKLAITSLTFIFSAWIFFITLADMRGFMEDHHIDLQFTEYIIIVLFLMSFYLVPKVIIYIIRLTHKKYFPDKIFNVGGKSQFLISGLISFLCGGIILYYYIPWLAPSYGEERNMLFWTALYWLVSIFLINILINSSEFENSIKYTCMRMWDGVRRIRR